MVNPPSNNMMTGVHMAAKMYLVAVLGSSRWCGFSSCLTICKTTVRNGTRSAVTKSGMTWNQSATVQLVPSFLSGLPLLPIASSQIQALRDNFVALAFS